MQMSVNCKILQLGEEYWSSVIVCAVGEHCAHSGVLCVWCAWQIAAEVQLMPHTLHTKTISDKTELNDDSTKNRGDRPFWR
jgi:hypothetical protein